MFSQKFHVATLLLIICSVILPIVTNAKTQVYYDFPVNYLPATPAQHPRIYLQNRIASLQTLYKTVPELEAVHAFKHDIDKLLSYSSACQDWRCNNGWPAAALALHWLLTGNLASGQKACDVFIPHFDGASPNNQGTDLYYALAYDWLFHHPCFTDAMKASLRAKLIAWSDDTALIDEAGSWTAHDSDRNIAATAGHFIAGLAIVGEDELNGLKLLKRGWTGWKYGINAHSLLPDFPVIKFFRTSLDTGIPLPGWDYGMMSDVHIAQNLYYIMDELGIIDAEFPDLKQWWVNSLTYFMHSVDPANTHYRWIGDQQNTSELDPGGGKYIWSYFSNCVFLAERYGNTTQAAIGRSFLDTLHRPAYGVSEGDTMLWFMTSWPDSAQRIDFKTNANRYALGGFGSGQHMGIGMFRSDWTSSTSFSDAKQVTWGGFYGIGSYIVDHMHNSAGSFWLWRNGEYLLTEPLNYGGNEAAIYPFTLWNSLSIPNEAVPNNNESYDNGGPVVYFNQNSAYLERGRADEKNKVFYALLNANYNYNVPENIWATCTGTCRQPVGKYTRSFVYDGTAEIVFLIDRVDLVRSRPVSLRFRTQNPNSLSTLVNANTVSVPSDKGNYQTLIRVLTPTLSDSWVIAPEPWTAVPAWQIQPSMIGSQVHKSFATALQHRIVTALSIGKFGDDNTALNNASLISSAPESIGACARSFCFVTTSENSATSRITVNYTTPLTMVANSRHLVTDLDAGGCYSITSSASGIIASGLSINAGDNTLWFVVPNSGAQGISIVKTADNVTGCVPEAKKKLTISKSGAGAGKVTSSPAGINCGTDCNESYAHGTKVTLTATANSGSTFSGWSGGGCSGTGVCVVTMNAAMTVTATFHPVTHSLIVLKSGVGMGTISSNPAGINCGTDCNENYAHGTKVTLTATANPGSIFSGWSGGGCAGTGVCLVTMNAAITVTATFVAPDFVVTGITLSPSTPIHNGTFKASVTVKNQGSVAGNAGSLGVWVNQPTLPACSATSRDQYVTVGILAAGASVTRTFTGLPVGSSGSKTFRAFVDKNCATPEAMETNNQSTKTYVVQ
ncbi:hypothetical protein CCP3SC5AM1_100021 [Gammaproteobacteria bacterium]